MPNPTATILGKLFNRGSGLPVDPQNLSPGVLAEGVALGNTLRETGKAVGNKVVATGKTIGETGNEAIRSLDRGQTMMLGGVGGFLGGTLTGGIATHRAAVRGGQAGLMAGALGAAGLGTAGILLYNILKKRRAGRG